MLKYMTQRSYLFSSICRATFKSIQPSAKPDMKKVHIFALNNFEKNMLHKVLLGL